MKNFHFQSPQIIILQSIANNNAIKISDIKHAYLLIIFCLGFVYSHAQSSGIKGVSRYYSSSSVLRNEAGAADEVIFLAEKGKEGYFKLDDNDANTKDNEGTVLVTRQGKRYKRLFEGEVNVLWFGAKGDGLTNDTDAFVKAISATTNSIYIPFKPNGYKIANVAITKTVTLRGDNKFNTIIKPAANNVACFITQAEFVEYHNLYFDGLGTNKCTGIEHKHRISTIKDCFFSGLSRGVFNSKQFVTGGKPDEQKIIDTRFRDCEYGIISEGHFINSNIKDCIFHGCKSAIFCFDDSYLASNSTTEGLVIEGCLLYSCGDKNLNLAAIQLQNIDFSYIRNCMVDLNLNTALSIQNSQFCVISNSYFSTAQTAATASAVVLSGNCSNSTFEGCQFYDNKKYGLEVIGLKDRISDNIRVNNTSARINQLGDFMVNGGTNIWINNCNFYSATNNNINAFNSLGKTSLFVRSSTINGGINRSSQDIFIDLKDCPNQPTLKLGVVTIPEGKQIISIAHGLTILAGQNAFVFTNNTTNNDVVKAVVIGPNLQLSREGNKGAVTVQYRAEVQ